MNRPEGIKPEYIKAGEALYDKIGFGAPRDTETLARAIQSSVEAERERAAVLAFDTVFEVAGAVTARELANRIRKGA